MDKVSKQENKGNGLFFLNPLTIISVETVEKSEFNYLYTWKDATWYGRKAGYYQLFDSTPYTAEQIMKEYKSIIVDDKEHKLYSKPHIHIKYADNSHFNVYYDDDLLMYAACKKLMEVIGSFSPMCSVNKKNNAANILN